MNFSIRLMVVSIALIIPFFRGNCDQFPPVSEGIFDKYAHNPLDLIAQFLPENPVIFEAGGFDGTDTIKISKKWPRSRIISFEANSRAFEVLIEATKQEANIQCYNLALNTHNGSAIFHLCHGSSGDNPAFEGASSLLAASEWMKMDYQGPKIVVFCVVLDDWCKKNKIDHIDFMWLDLEGMELQVLRSSPKILETVKVIYTETNFQEFRVGTTQYKDLNAFLEKAGFKLLVHWYMGYVGDLKGQGNAIFVRI